MSCPYSCTAASSSDDKFPSRKAKLYARLSVRNKKSAMSRCGSHFWWCYEETGRFGSGILGLAKYNDMLCWGLPIGKTDNSNAV